MTDYKEVRIDCAPCSDDITALLADSLAERGYESFLPDERGLTAYVADALFSQAELEEAIADCPIPFEAKVGVTTVEGRDWNEEWEKNYFRPIRVGGRCLVRSSFHDEEPAEIEIVVDPKMAFGTGHHATTSQMMELLLASDLKGKRVLDMGAGTGILSILSRKLGASEVVGVEIDPDAADNARDNARLNEAEVEMLTGDSSLLEGLGTFDLLAANINRNVILADLGRYAEALRTGGEMLLSGFFTEDVPLVERAARLRGLEKAEERSASNWAALRLRKA